MSGTPSLPTERYLGDCYRFEWADEQIEMELDRFLEATRDGLGCEITITSSQPPAPGLLHQARFNLTSTSARASLARSLSARRDDVDFGGLLEQACFLSLKRWREGDPIINLWDVTPREKGRFLLEPFIEFGGPTTLFGDGGAGKSVFALALGLSVVSGFDIVGSVPTTKGAVLYLDWETDKYVHAERLTALAMGLPRPIDSTPLAIHYRRQFATLAESIGHLRKEAARLGVEFVIVDSLGAARGGEPESADLTIRTFNAARAFGLPVLFIDHLPKNAVDKSKPFGSVYTHNLSRITWGAQLERQEGSGQTLIGMTNHKANNGAPAGKRGYRLTWGSKITYETIKATDVPALAKGMTYRAKIIGVLQAAEARRATAPQIVDALCKMTGDDVKLDTVEKTLKRYDNDFVSLPDYKGFWGLRGLTAVAQ